MTHWDTIVSFENLCRAAKRAARAKRGVRGAARFLERLEPEVLALQRELKAGEWRPGKCVRFVIVDPKERVITAAPFRDRVVHHALIDPLEPMFDSRLVPQSFACRRGKGCRRALEHVRGLVERHEYFLKLDIAKCFESIRHDKVLEAVEECTQEPEVLGLVEVVLSGPAEVKAAARVRGREGEPGKSGGGAPGGAGRGLPIGNLTSQWFANLLLGRIDRRIVEAWGIDAYARYMDDFLVFGASKAELRAVHAGIERFVAEELDLRLKSRATLLAPVRVGVPFLGWRLQRGGMRLRPENARRTVRRLRHRRWQWREGRIDSASYLAGLQSVVAHLEQGAMRDWRVKVARACSLTEAEWAAGPMASPRASTAGAASTMPPRTRVPRTATTTRRRTRTTTSASVPPR